MINSAPTIVSFRFFESVYQYITKAFGVVYSTTTQTASANTPTAISFDTAGTSRSISIGVDPTTVQITREGAYSIELNIQFVNSTASIDDVVVWVKVNGVNVANSARWAMAHAKHGSTDSPLLLTCDNLLYLYPRDYIQVYWMSIGGHVKIDTLPSSVSPSYPMAPSVVMFVDQTA